jgi:hypothetical protein
VRRLAALAAAVAALGAGCGGEGEPACGECGPALVAVAEGDVLVAQGGDLHRLDPATGAVEATTTVLPRRRSVDLAAIDGRGGVVALATASAVVVLDRDGDEAARAGLRPAAYPAGIALRGPRVLVAGGRLLRIASGGQVTAESPRLPARAVAMAVDGARAWVGGAGYVRPFDAATAGPAGPRSAVTAGAGGLAAADGRVWAADGGGLTRIDAATGRPSVRVDEPADLIALAEGALWSLTRDGVLTRRDPDTGRPVAAPVDVGDEPRSLVAGGGAVYVGLRHPAVVRVDAAGGVVWRRDVPLSR